MAEFRYICASADGHFQRGSRSAADKNDLIQKLDQEGLFLIFWREAKPAPEPNAPPEPEGEEKPSRFLWPRLEEKSAKLRSPAFLRQRSSQAIAFSVFLFSFLSARLLAPRRPDSVLPPRQLRHQIYSIKSGMTREDVERIFPRAGNLNTSTTTYYQPASNVWIEVFYDDTGGAWNLQNKVIRQAKMHVILKGATPAPGQPKGGRKVASLS